VVGGWVGGGGGGGVAAWRRGGVAAWRRGGVAAWRRRGSAAGVAGVARLGKVHHVDVVPYARTVLGGVVR
jgi:hypothetical protein